MLFRSESFGSSDGAHAPCQLRPVAVRYLGRAITCHLPPVPQPSRCARRELEPGSASRQFCSTPMFDRRWRNSPRRVGTDAYAADVKSDQQWVEALAFPSQRIDAMRSLIGGVNARDLRSVVVTEGALQALIDGLRHGNAQVRWWCVQLLDHCSDVRAIEAVVPMLDDPVC